MNSSAVELTGDLRDELAKNAIIDPRTVPARHHNLKAFGQSAAHAFATFQNVRFDSLAVRIGSGTHAILFNQPFAVFTGKVRNGKAWSDFKEQHPHGNILSVKEHDKAQAIASAVRSDERANRVLFGPGVIHERTILWEQLGRARRSTPDARSDRHLCELKTTRCAEPGRFQRDGVFRAYNAQLADQSAAIEFETGRPPKDVYIVAVESVFPYVVEVMRLTPRALEHGARLNRIWLEQLLACEAANAWPGYSQSISDFDVMDDASDLVFGDDGDDSATEGQE